MTADETRRVTESALEEQAATKRKKDAEYRQTLLQSERRAVSNEVITPLYESALGLVEAAARAGRHSAVKVIGRMPNEWVEDRVIRKTAHAVAKRISQDGFTVSVKEESYSGAWDDSDCHFPGATTFILEISW